MELPLAGKRRKKRGIVCVCRYGVCVEGCGSVLSLRQGQHAPPDAQDESTKGMLTMQRAPQRKLLSGASNGALQGRGQGPTGFSDSQAENGL